MLLSRFRLLALCCLLWCGAAAPLAAQKRATTALTNGTPSITTSDGVKLYVKVSGQGVPCVFVHGGPGAGSYSFEALGGRGLEKDLQMIYLDQRGSGQSASDPAGNYSLERQVQDLEELRQQLKLERWVLMSHSFGGTIATQYAAKHPERVQALILVNSILNLPATMETTATYGYSLLPAEGRPPLDPAMPLPQRWGMVMGLLGQQKLMGKLMYVSDTAAARASQVVRSVPANRDFGQAVFKQPEYLQDFTPASASLRMPVLVISGKDDYVTGPEHYKSFRFPNQQVVVLPGKHYPFLENPREFQQAVAAFVRKLPRKA
ncbi:alpha/beta fold hydrolase [Hymenobacter sp. CRA2]|uniref:alpha/beta fold hydrolase n=1 Tax=Hymenobacter sp. CRA2 TaxID=1955620 RepID=UPI00099011CA|nr:alpha/beta hydrolase [Hymenobacter sp. CRA2]